MRVGNVTAAGARLTLANHRGQWAYRADRGPHTACSPARSAPSVDLAGLQPNTAYRYRAYADPACAAPLASVPFTTAALAYPSPRDRTSQVIALAAPTATPAPVPPPTPPATPRPAAAAASVPTPIPTPAPTLTPPPSTSTSTAAPTPDAIATATPTPAATPTPSLMSYGVTATTARLTIANYDGPWRYRPAAGPDAGPAAACAPAGPRGAALSGLSPDTPYTYRAYAAAAADDCSPANLLGAASFTTARPALSASDVTPIRARLTLDGWLAGAGPGRDGNWYYRYRAGLEPVPVTVTATQPWSACSPAQSAATRLLDGLFWQQDYTVKAYRDAQCAREIASVTFQTPNLSIGGGIGIGISGVPTPQPTPAPTSGPTPTPTPAPTIRLARSGGTATTATLTLTNWNASTWYYQANKAPHDTCTAVTTDSIDLTDLAPNTSYTYTAYSDGNCTVVVTSVTFTTPKPTLTRSAVTATTATLKISNWNISVDGNWWYKYTSPTGGSCTPNDTTGISAATADLTGLSANTAYTFTAYGDSACATSITDDFSFTTAAPSLSRSNFTATTVKLTISNDWNIDANKDGNWYYKANAAPHTSCTAASTRSVTLTGLTVGTAYTYTAYSDSGCNDEVASASGFTTYDTALAGSNPTATTATLTISDWNIGVDGSWWYKYTTPTGGVCKPNSNNNTGLSTSTASLTGLKPNTTYTFKAYSDRTCSTAAATASGFKTANPTLTPGSNPTATTATLTISNEWNFTKDGSWYYKADKAPHTTCSSSGVSTATANLNGLTPDESYTYTAYSDSNCSTVAATASAFTTDDPALAAGSNPTATTATLTISDWTVGTGVGQDGNWYYKYTVPTTGGTCSSAQTTATDDLSGLTVGTAYTYKAYSDSGCTTELATASGFTTAAPALAGTSPTATTATLTISDKWNLSKDKTWYYEADKAPYKDTCSSGGSASSTASLTGLTVGTAYTFKAYTDSTCNTEAAEADEFNTAAPSLAVSSVGKNTATLTLSGWTRNKDGNWYYKYTSPTGGSCTADTGNDLSVDLTGLVAETSYNYRAYSDSNCTTEITSEVAYFTTGVAAKLAVFNIKQTTASLGVIDHSGSWYYKADKGPDTTCSDEQTGQSDSLTGLTAGETYTYTAYSDSACNTQLETGNDQDQVTFTVGHNVNNLRYNAHPSFFMTVGDSGGLNYQRAVGFRTGAKPGGYTLASITARFLSTTDAINDPSPGDLVVELYTSDSSGDPDASIATLGLSGGGNPDAAGDYTFTCSTGCDLNANTDYFLVMSATSADRDNHYSWRATNSGNETQVPANNGWSLQDRSKLRVDGGNWESPNNNAGMFRVSFTVQPGLTATGVTATGATLNLFDYEGAWWYQGSQADATCESVAAGTKTAGLTGLDASTSYTYKAYKATNCASADKIAEVTFTTSASS